MKTSIVAAAVLSLWLGIAAAPNEAGAQPAAPPVGAAAAPPPVVIYTKDNAPAAPKVEDLALKDSVSQHGVTWTFDKPVRVGQFVSGDSYVVGPVTVKSVSPAPLWNEEVKDPTPYEVKGWKDRYARNGSTLNLPVAGWPGFDSRTQGHRYDPNRFARFPLAMKPGDALVSTISLSDTNVQNRMLGPSDHKSVTAIRIAAVLTCLANPAPADAFRPSYCDRGQTLYLARNLKRDLLPKLAAVKSAPKPEEFAKVFERPWIDTVFFGFSAPSENMPQYGREVARAAGMGTLLLCCDFEPARKEKLLLGIAQAGVDYWGLLQAGHPGWPAYGGHGSGRKWILVFTGIVLGEADMQNPYAKHPAAKFGEDMHTIYGQGWTGATALYAGHLGKEGSKNNKGWGAYEHLPPAQWEDRIGEGYRYCCTSVAWVGEGLAIRLLRAEKIWDHDAFLDYCDRWMNEDATEFAAKIKEAKGWDFTGSSQRKTWDKFVDEMWAQYRATNPAPADGWKKPHPPTP